MLGSAFRRLFLNVTQLFSWLLVCRSRLGSSVSRSDLRLELEGCPVVAAVMSEPSSQKTACHRCYGIDWETWDRDTDSTRVDVLIKVLLKADTPDYLKLQFVHQHFSFFQREDERVAQLKDMDNAPPLPAGSREYNERTISFWKLYQEVVSLKCLIDEVEGGTVPSS